MVGGVPRPVRGRRKSLTLLRSSKIFAHIILNLQSAKNLTLNQQKILRTSSNNCCVKILIRSFGENTSVLFLSIQVGLTSYEILYHQGEKCE